MKPLTVEENRERQEKVREGMAEGKSYTQIAQELKIKPPTLRQWLRNQKKKEGKSEPAMVVLDKLEKEELSFGSLEELAAMTKKIKRTTESKQRHVTVEPVNPGKWLGLAVIGDLHWGDKKQDIDTVIKHTDLILNTDNMIAVQLGDLLHEEGSLTHRGASNREAPDEFPLDVARKACFMWMEKIGPKLAAFIVGNHDERPIRTELYDIGEESVHLIEGAYLGYNGYLHVVFSDYLEYTFFLDHYGKGSSMYNCLHPGMRILHEPNKDTPDGIFFGHVHGGPAMGDIPIKGGRALIVRASGYDTWGGRFGWKIDGIPNEPSTPVILLNPFTKQMIPFLDLEKGIALLRLLNGDK